MSLWTQLTLCDPVWHVGSCSNEAGFKLLCSIYYTYVNTIQWRPTVSDTLPELVDDASGEVEDVVCEGCVGDAGRGAGWKSSLVSQQHVGSQQLIHQVVEYLRLVVVSVWPCRVLGGHLSHAATFTCCKYTPITTPWLSQTFLRLSIARGWAAATALSSRCCR